MVLLNFFPFKTKYHFITPFISGFITLLLLSSCNEHYTPKNKSYFRIEFPNERIFTTYSNNICPFTFEYATYGFIQKDSTNTQELNEHPCWFNIIYPEYKAKVYLSYSSINSLNTLDKLIKDSYKLTFKHTVKADYIDETSIKGIHKNVSGILYDVGGNAASSVQFYVTDSVQHFIRGSLYFYSAPNVDSIAPVAAYFRDDVIHLVKSIHWK
ncbi:MAG TPA: gliding motility lipoprotein GldD [Chitinophagales bacterium]|jgi:gliding motility-associated lipoprotein GldD|nr:gliding motility lipoprotein GldD [Chitinophagales bacterium]MBP6153591.1 gliding motility lipoprotein GldD [Chitinophagales bacterium]HQV77909.1 gliding motility lipoprotein GldD [Chitinophagales bacterium]HQW78631.1 gliding motility lipoprotein GldD [Chitinophagales bacterium]HRB67477.1 gliding motility lipoprotein GldD [Chitinophagales bacterium]